MNLHRPPFPTSSFSTIAHKRTRPTDELSNHLPSLPQLSTDLILQVYTHASLRRAGTHPEDHGDNERLIPLGRAVLDATVTLVLFHERPMLTAIEISVQKDLLISSESINKWVDMYGMSRRLRCHPDVFSKLDTPEEARALFYAYIGGVYSERGLGTVQQWMSQLLLGLNDGIAPPFDPPPKKIKNEESSSYTTPPIFFGSQPPPSPPRQVPKPANPLSPAQPTLSFLPLFNQMATQRRVTVEYPAEFRGPPHAGQWTVQCVGKLNNIGTSIAIYVRDKVNGISKGVGGGSSKQIAKEEAARQAYYAMGWT